MRKQIAAANWKMNLTLAQGETLIDDLLNTQHSMANQQVVILAVPFPYLIKMHERLQGRTNFFVAAQNCAATKNGAYTGEVSTEMLGDTGISYVLTGHSERREYFGETNRILAEKVDRAFEYNLQTIFCCGEPLTVREAEMQNSYIETQLKESLFHLSKEQMNNFIIAYEPIWAIGTGKTAGSGQAQEMHAHIRSIIANEYGSDTANSVSILYGGSVKASNAADIFSKPDVDGGLVGGASLVAAEFAGIIGCLK